MSGSIIGSISDRPLQTQQAAKRRLRQIVRERYAAADRARLKVASDHVMQALEQLPEFIAARCVALYWSLPGEVETHAFAEKWRHEKQVLLPVMHGDGLLLYPFTGREHLVQRRFGVWEPDPEAPFSALPGTPVPDTTSEHTPNRKSLLAAHTTQVPRTNPPQAQPTEPAELTGSGPRSRPDRRTCRRIRPARQPARPRQRLLRQVAPGHTGIESRYLFRFSAFRAYSGRRARRPDGPDHRRLPGRKRALPL